MAIVKKKKKLLFINDYFYPDVASTGQLLTELCLELQHEFDVTVIASSGYADSDEGSVRKRRRIVQEKLEGIHIHRIGLSKPDKKSKLSRLIHISVFFALAFRVILKEKRVAAIYTTSQPPILAGLLGSMAKLLKRCKFVYNIQDFNPEQAEAVNFVSRRWVTELARKVDKFSCRRADHIVLVGRDMGETLKKRFKGKPVPEYTVINNWIDEQSVTPLAKSDPGVSMFLREYKLENKFVVMYSGNIGLYYDLENLIKVASMLEGLPDVRFAFVGEGAVKEDMERYVQTHGLCNVVFIPYQPRERLLYSLNAADIHLVVNQKGIKGVSVPSKVYGVLATGKPVLGVLEEGSEAATLIQESRSGLVVEPGQYEGAAQAIRTIAAMSDEMRELMGMRGRTYLEEYLRKDVSLMKYKQLFASLVADGFIDVGRPARMGATESK
ncbi:glycosyltransferase family 4 protein [Paenibacillus oenotherae]|uniref:Glycosyltransferase family 4 protein n=1 Tax=Paenibacillus oenotherae TaxID=1435645 RepID=A0ABS7DA19_9BACL|nr:glycosyltransferase family 4 protein [Paenibacillus oenotherae]MBW7476725.1 glycosyltransferase family 4 protein [Paenibacillus oenotherae]